MCAVQLLWQIFDETNVPGIESLEETSENVDWNDDIRKDENFFDFCERIAEQYINIEKTDWNDFSDTLLEHCSAARDILIELSHAINTTEEVQRNLDYRKVIKAFKCPVNNPTPPPTKKQIMNMDFEENYDETFFVYCCLVAYRLVNYKNSEEPTEQMFENGANLGCLFYRLAIQARLKFIYNSVDWDGKIK